MKSIIVNAIVAVCLSLFMVTGCSDQQQPTTTKNDGMFRHIVFIKFNPELSPEKVEEIMAEFAALEGKIPSMLDFEWGTEDNIEKSYAEGFTHSALLTFKDKAGLEAYWEHADHDRFVELLVPNAEKIMALGFVVK